MKEKLTLQDLQEQNDPLVIFNEAYGRGIDYGLNNAFWEFDLNNRDTWPTLGKPFIGYWGGAWPLVELVVLEDYGDGNVVCLPAYGVQEKRAFPTHCMSVPDCFER
jgi:hypothetical protein